MSEAPLVLADDDGHAVHLWVRGYEFPDTTDAQNPDSQWLQIGVRLSGPELETRFDDPCLTLSEAASLGAWFASLAQTAPGALPEPALTFLDFAEPLLACGLRDAVEDGIKLAVVLPQSDDEPRVPDAWPDVLEVLADREDLAEMAEAWLAELDALPPRR
ncbi:MAG: hypothetical protein LBE25_15770 [Arthrobacter sp.]|jgi:hypothetical protein|nr:hypothetical protein [Arthrobacter sp.]